MNTQTENQLEVIGMQNLIIETYEKLCEIESYQVFKKMIAQYESVTGDENFKRNLDLAIQERKEAEFAMREMINYSLKNEDKENSKKLIAEFERITGKKFENGIIL